MATFDRAVAATGAVGAALGIAMGAFGAHALEARLGADALGWWQIGVQYQMWNAIGLIALASLGRGPMRAPGWTIAAGTLVFAGTLYAMALGGPRSLGAVTPLGGLLMIVGWLWAVLRAARGPAAQRRP